MQQVALIFIVSLAILVSNGTAGAAVLSVSAASDSLSNGKQFQAALNAAIPGDTIELQAGGTFSTGSGLGTYSGAFELPAKSCGATSEEECWITVRTSAVDQLPAPGSRIHPSDSAALPK